VNAMAKRQKQLYLSDDVAEWLSERDNQSQTVEAALREVHDI